MTTPSDPTCRLLGMKTFGVADQLLFARASGDYNPMHMDAVAARRLIAGRQVVHGVHVFFSALEFFEYEAGLADARLNCTFISPICVGDHVSFTQRADQTGSVLLDALVDGLVCAEIKIERSDVGPLSDRAPAAQTGEVPAAFALQKQPLHEDPSFHVNKAYRLKLKDGDLEIHFPRSCRLLGTRVTASIASLSYFVGMVCPGLHSVFSSFTCRLRTSATSLPHLDFLVRKYDSRFRLVDIAFDGPVCGSLRAFLRPSPQEQVTIEELAELVRPDEFAGTLSLIVGGSRGLGELTAKILAAGGGKVEITFASGVEDARRIQEEITSSGKGECVITKLDLAVDDFGVCGTLGDPSMVFFYATPRIFRKKTKHFDEDVFRDFCFFYISRFFDLCSYLETRIQPKRALVYLPSSVAIADRPRGIAEYAMAKAAAEVLAQEINGNFKNVSVVSTRLPRLNTDQTATIFAAASESNVGTLLPLIRSMHATVSLAASQG